MNDGIIILIVSAKEIQFDGTFHKGQLKEHILLCTRSDIDNILVDVNQVY